MTKQLKIFVNIETRAEFKARETCIAEHCKSPLPMGQSNTLCLACQKQYGVTAQAEIEAWQNKQNSAKKPDKTKAQAVDEFLDNLIKAKTDKQVLTNT